MVFEKEMSVGGRLATGKFGAGNADYGAQFFTVRSNEFRGFVDQWLALGLVYEWSRGWSDGSLFAQSGNGYPRYAARGGMSELAGHLARDLKGIYRGVPIVRVGADEFGWIMESEDARRYRGKSLILTAPVPQSLRLLDNSQVKLSEKERNALERIEYGLCLCGIFVIDGEVNLPEPGALQRPQNVFSWIADNQRKGISPDARVMTIHAAPDYSREHYADNDQEILAALRNEAQKHLSEEAQIVEEKLKRWRYSIPLRWHPAPCMVAETALPLVFAGDAFGGPGRVEGAALSGLAAGRAVIELLGSETER